MNTRLQVEHPVTEEHHRPRPGRAAARGRRRRPPGRRTACRRRLRRSRPGSTPRTRRRTGSRRPARCIASTSPRPRDRIRDARGAHRNPAGLRHRRRLGGVDPLRPDAGQGDLLRPDPAARRRWSGRRAGAGTGARPAHQPRPAGERAAASGVPGRRHRHRVLRHARPGGLAAPLADDAVVRLSAVAAALADAAHNRGHRHRARPLPSGWRNLASGSQAKAYLDDAGERASRRIPVRPHRIDAAGRRRRSTLVSATPDDVVLADDHGVRRRFAVARYGAQIQTSTSTRPWARCTCSRSRASPSRARPSKRARWSHPCPAP